MFEDENNNEEYDYEDDMNQRIFDEERELCEDGDDDPDPYAAAWNAGWNYQPPDIDDEDEED